MHHPTAATKMQFCNSCVTFSLITLILVSQFVFRAMDLRRMRQQRLLNQKYQHWNVTRKLPLESKSSNTGIKCQGYYPIICDHQPLATIFQWSYLTRHILKSLQSSSTTWNLLFKMRTNEIINLPIFIKRVNLQLLINVLWGFFSMLFTKITLFNFASNSRPFSFHLIYHRSWNFKITAWNTGGFKAWYKVS